MNIAEVKAVISNATGLFIGTIDLRGEELNDGTVDTTWQYMWIESKNPEGANKRVRIVFPEEVVDTIKGDMKFNGLAVKHEIVPAHKAGEINPVTKKAWTADLAAAYERFTVITPKFTASF